MVLRHFIYVSKDLNQQSFEKFNMKNYSSNVVIVVKGDKLNLNECPKNNFEHEHMKNIYML